ncbi:hypothetical protein DNTS_021581, partial [Danionella cerebrum]
MLRGLQLIVAICSASGFNIQVPPVKSFQKEDPLFGQTVIQSKHGVFVPSAVNGKLFECTLEKECVEINLHDEIPNGMRPVASVASLISEEHLLVMKTKLKTSEYFNGNCSLLSPAGKVRLAPDELVTSRDNNPSTHKAQRFDQDAGIEIAFVLDGSGSITREDFQKAKEFIYNCDFAIVQYGYEIRTELSLQENKEPDRSLKKVTEIKQVNNVTKTASAINHVLTEIFIPEKGSKKNSEKIIIVMSDGEILGDTMNLRDVLNKPEMKGITRYAIGEKAIAEMKQIADPDKFYTVSNYAALQDILSRLAADIIGPEGTDQGLQLQLAEAGFSTHLLQKDKMVESLFGAVGAYNWNGGVIVKSGNHAKFLNDSNNGPKFAYLGYSVTSAQLPSKTLYISGAPRYNLTGGVFVFDDSDKYVLLGDQVGSYFGSVLCTLDINNDGKTDYLFVGAPHFHHKGEEGKVTIYHLNEERFKDVFMELQGDSRQTFARFGAAIASIGNIDGDQFNDIAIGAPLEADSSGSVYIYRGVSEGFQLSQKISPSDFKISPGWFGQSVSAVSSSPSGHLCLAVGSKQSVMLFETIPVMIITPSINTDLNTIPLVHQSTTLSKEIKIKFSVCFNVKKGDLKAEETQPIEYEIDLDSGANKKRLSGCFDCFLPLEIKLNFSLGFNPHGAPLRILDPFKTTEIVKKIYFEKDCKSDVCNPNITLSDSEMSGTMIKVGETQSLNINFKFRNTGDSSFMTTLTLTYPSILSQQIIKGATCPLKTDNQIQCSLQPPVFKSGEQMNLLISWQPNDVKSDIKTFEIIANLTSWNNGTQILDTKAYPFSVMYFLPIQLHGTASPNRLRIEEGQSGNTRQIHFEFQECVYPENFKVENSYSIKCIMKELQKITIDADVLIHDVQGKSDKITVTGQYSFDETVYAAKDTLRNFAMEVEITKLQVVMSTGQIIGGSIGGFLLLFIFIIILIKVNLILKPAFTC